MVVNNAVRSREETAEKGVELAIKDDWMVKPITQAVMLEINTWHGDFKSSR